MPGKYSHSVVLADYSNHGVIYPPDDQLLVYLRSLGNLPPVPVPQTVTLHPPVKSGERSTTAISSTWQACLPDVEIPTRQPQPKSNGCVTPNQLQEHAHKQQSRRLILDLENDASGHGTEGTEGKDAQSHRPNSVQHRLSADLISRTLDAYTEKEVCFLQPDTQVPVPCTSRDAIVFKTITRPSTSRPLKFQPRNDVESFQQFRYRGAPLSPTQSHRGEPLLSVQEFLNASPRLKEDNTASKQQRSTFSSSTFYGKRQSPQSPPSQDKGSKRGYLSSTRPSMPSLRDGRGINFTNSSDDGEGVARITPTPDLRDLTSNFASRSNDTSRRRKIMDLTEELHILTTRGAPNSQWDTQSVEAQRADARMGQLRTKKTYDISDIDDSELSELDGIELRPPQRPSTFSRPQSKHGGGPLQGQDLLFDVPDDQLSPLTPHSAQSFDSPVGGMSISSVKPDFLQFSNRGRPNGDYFSRAPLRNDHLHRGSPRNVDNYMPKNEPQADKAVNSPVPRGTVKMAGPSHQVRNNSVSSADGIEQTLSVPQGAPPRSHRQNFESRPSFSTSPDTQAAALPRSILRASTSTPGHGSSTPPFGTPSIVRNPEKIAVINAETQRRSAASPRASTNSDFQASSTRTTPTKERKHHRHRLPVMGSKNVSLLDLAQGWSGDRKSRFESMHVHEQTPTNMETSMTAAMDTQAGQIRKPPSIQTSRAASLSAPSLIPVSSNQTDRGSRLVFDSDSGLDFPGHAGGGWPGQDSRLSPAGIQRPVSDIRAGLHQRPGKAEHYDNANDERGIFGGYEDDEDNNDNDMIDHGAALPPPDISRCRRSAAARRRSLNDGDRVETIFRVLREGPGPRSSNRVSQRDGQDGVGEEMDAMQDHMYTRRSNPRTRRKSVLGRLVMRRR
ncbi:hypothetical protein A1O3_09723 [Capronia epimyces CBS 606.96]|uniref:Uncharacterized protein n=1 Tax=Capronia epimyces CBS 606.96 TaxID=1182542 RepID=W9XAK0_9EURO|nr:uncharacterized protein A1O3_09723 [Capronia epimyces CBS 606.96]EXJ77497.1 hypothetical protein A1O3_09723 [Capronia epimyces CBS 606.96]